MAYSRLSSASTLATVFRDFHEFQHAESRGRERQVPRDMLRAILKHGLSSPSGAPSTEQNGGTPATYQSFCLTGTLGTVIVRAVKGQDGWRLMVGAENATTVVTQWLNGWLGDFDLEGEDGAEGDELPSVLKKFGDLVQESSNTVPVLMPTMPEGSSDGGGGSGGGVEPAAATGEPNEEEEEEEEEVPTCAALEDFFESGVARPHYHIVCKGGELFWLGVEPAENGGGHSVHLGVGALCAAAGAELPAEFQPTAYYGLTYSVVETVWPAPKADNPGPLLPTTRLTTVVVEDRLLQRHRSTQDGVLEGGNLGDAIAAARAQPTAEGGYGGGGGGGGGIAAPPKMYLGADALGAVNPHPALVLSEECAVARVKAKMEAQGYIRMREVGLPAGGDARPRTWVRRLVMRKRLPFAATEAAMEEEGGQEEAWGDGVESVSEGGPQDAIVSSATAGCIAARCAESDTTCPTPPSKYSLPPYTHHTPFIHTTPFHPFRCTLTQSVEGSDMVDICSSDPAIRGHIYSTLVNSLAKTTLPKPSSLSGSWMDSVHDNLPQYHMLQLPLPLAGTPQAQAAGASSDFLLNLVMACSTASGAEQPSRRDALQRQAVGERSWPLFTNFTGSRTDSGRMYIGVGALLETTLSDPEKAEAEHPTHRFYGRDALGGPSLARYASEKQVAEEDLVERLGGLMREGDGLGHHLWAHGELPVQPHHRPGVRSVHDFVGVTRECDTSEGGIRPVRAVASPFPWATSTGQQQQPPVPAKLTFSRAYTSFFCPNADTMYKHNLAHSYWPLWNVHEVQEGGGVREHPIPCTAPEGFGQCDARAAAIALRLGSGSRAGIEPVADEEALGQDLTAKLDVAKAAAEAENKDARLRGLALCQGLTYHGGLLMQHGAKRLEFGSRLLSRFPAATLPEKGDEVCSLNRLCIAPEQLVLQAMVLEGGEGGGLSHPPAALTGRDVLAALLLPSRLSEMCHAELGGQLCKAALLENKPRFGTWEQLLSLRALTCSGHSLLGQICRENQVGLLWWLLRSKLFTPFPKQAKSALQHSGYCIKDWVLGKALQWNTVQTALPPDNAWLGAVQQWWDDDEVRYLDKELQPTAFEYALCCDSLETAAVITFASKSVPSLLDCYDYNLPNLVKKYGDQGVMWPRDCFPVLPYNSDLPTYGGADAAGAGMGDDFFRENAVIAWERMQAFLEHLADARDTSAYKRNGGMPYYNRLVLYVRGLNEEAPPIADMQNLFQTAAGVGPGDAPTYFKHFPGGGCKVTYATPEVAQRARWATNNKFRFGARKSMQVTLAEASVGGGGGGDRGGYGKHGGGWGGGGSGSGGSGAW